MKYLLTSIAALLLLTITNAQDLRFAVSESQMKVGDNPINVFEIHLSNNHQFGKREFKSLCLDHLGIKLRNDRKSLFSSSVILPGAGDKEGDLRVLIYQNGSGTNVAIGFDLGSGMSLNTKDFPGESEYFLNLIVECLDNLEQDNTIGISQVDPAAGEIK